MSRVREKNIKGKEKNTNGHNTDLLSVNEYKIVQQSAKEWMDEYACAYRKEDREIVLCVCLRA